MSTFASRTSNGTLSSVPAKLLWFWVRSAAHAGNVELRNGTAPIITIPTLADTEIFQISLPDGPEFDTNITVAIDGNGPNAVADLVRILYVPIVQPSNPALPTVANCSPSTAINNSRTQFTLTGTNFQVGAKVEFAPIASTTKSRIRVFPETVTRTNDTTLDFEARVRHHVSDPDSVTFKAVVENPDAGNNSAGTTVHLTVSR